MTNPNQNSDNNPGSSSGYGSNDRGDRNAWGAGNSSFNTDWITDPYRENPYEANVFDNAYTEALSNPNPTHNYKSKKSGLELE